MLKEAERLLAEQMRFLRRIKTMKESKLRRLHDSTFIGTKYAFKVPRWMHRSVLERRLFYFFCVKHYHYEREHPIAVEFRKKARFMLSKDYITGLDPAEQAKQALKEEQNFTVTNIKAMPIVEVDRYLASLSLYVEGPERSRRRVLWEWFNKPSSQLIGHLNHDEEKVTPRKKGALNNKYRIRDLILQNPRICYADFMDAFGAQMPTVTRESFNNARCILRKAGYDIPRLPNGPSRPAVVSGPYGHKKRARMLNDTTLLGVEHGEGQESADPF